MSQAPDLSDLLVAAADELRRARGPSLVKTRDDAEERKASLRREVHGEFVATCDALEEQGVIHADLARYFGVSPTCISDWYKHGATERKQLNGVALPGVKRLLASLQLKAVVNG